jgi:dihydropyrimidinase
MPSLLVKNATVVNATSRQVADVLVEGETITAVGPGLSAPEGAEILDATGHLVFPGFIDPHVHVYLPFMGTFAKDDYASASRAALMGGTTTIIEMCCPSRAEDPIEAFQLWKGKADGLSACDFTFHLGVTRMEPGDADKLRRLVEDEGVASFKIFLAYKGALGIDDAELYETLKLAKELGVIVTAHCENAELVAARQRELIAEGKIGPEWHEPSRPVQVEADGCHHLMTFAKLTGAHVYVVHTSCQEAVEVIAAARKDGVHAWIETVIPYLVLDSSYAERPDFEGAKYVMSPPIRDKRHQEPLWRGLADGTIATVGTDHAPFDFATQKHMGHPDPAKCVDAAFQPRHAAGDFSLIPNGIPSLEERVKLLYTHGVVPGKITLERFVDIASTQAAKIFGLHPRKGEIAPGADADLVVFDPEATSTISASTHSMATDYSGFEGWEVKGGIRHVTVRGQFAVRDGAYTGQKGHGRYLPRPRTH